MNITIDKKISLVQGKNLVTTGYLTRLELEDLIRQGLVAGPREKESHRLIGVKENITVSFPTPSVTLRNGRKLANLDKEDLAIVKKYKDTLAARMRPIFETTRDEFTEKIMVKQ